MEQKQGAPDVPYIIYEEAVARLERTIRRLVMVLVLFGAALIAHAVELYFRFFA